MSGHNKWSKIKHKKAVTDAKKSNIFGKFSRLISVEAKKSGGDINSPGLRSVIEKAKKANMPNDNIEKAIKKANEVGNLGLVIFEAHGPGGVGIIIEALTDNNNRTSAEIKHILSKNDLSLGARGSVSWGFVQNKENMEWLANSFLDISEVDLNKLLKIIDMLKENDDVQEVYVNIKLNKESMK